MRAASIWYEMIMLMVMLLCGATSLTSVVVMLNKPIITYTNEKTALDSFDIENIEAYPRYGRDLLAALVNTDENAPYPNAIKIDDSPILLIDNTFHTRKFSVIAEVYDSGGPYQLSNKLDLPIKAMKFEVIGGKDVMHYYIQQNPPS